MSPFRHIYKLKTCFIISCSQRQTDSPCPSTMLHFDLVSRFNGVLKLFSNLFSSSYLNNIRGFVLYICNISHRFFKDYSFTATTTSDSYMSCQFCCLFYFLSLMYNRLVGLLFVIHRAVIAVMRLQQMRKWSDVFTEPRIHLKTLLRPLKVAICVMLILRTLLLFVLTTAIKRLDIT